MFAFDDYDLRLLKALQRDSRLTHQELSDHVHLSASQCQRRLKKLEESGVISQYVTVLDRELSGFDVVAMVNVSLKNHGRKSQLAFSQEISMHSEILECWAATGDSDYLLKVVAEDLKAFNIFLMDVILNMPTVETVRSNILLQELKYSTALPLDKIG